MKIAALFPLMLAAAACTTSKVVTEKNPGLVATGTDAASQLALRVYLAAGGEKLGDVSELDFTFAVYQDGAKKFAAKHQWNLRASRDRVTWTDRQGVAHDETADLTKGDKNDKAYARWVNDSYWLILPLKLFDPGIHRVLESPREWGGKTYDILRLSYSGVGLTPGDTYWLFVDRDTNRIARWEMVLEGEKPPPEGNSFEDYRAVGPLMLALDHVTDDKKERIVFEETSAR